MGGGANILLSPPPPPPPQPATPRGRDWYHITIKVSDILVHELQKRILSLVYVFIVSHYPIMAMMFTHTAS